MRFTGATIYGVSAAIVTFLSTSHPGVVGAMLLMLGLLLWILFIVAVVRALKPE